MSVRDRPWLPYALVLGAGLTLGALQYALDNRDPLVFTIPILVLTAVVLGVMALAGRGGEPDWSEQAAEAGLSDDGVRPVPPVTAILAGVTGPARMLSGRLSDDGPWVRVTRVRAEIVAITDAPAPALDPATEAWLAERDRRAGIQDGLLVVAAPAEASPRELLDLTRQVVARL